MRCHMLRGPQINIPFSGGGFLCLISHDKCKNHHLTLPFQYLPCVSFDKYKQCGASLVIVKRARLAGQHGLMVSFLLDTLCMIHAVMKST